MGDDPMDSWSHRAIFRSRQLGSDDVPEIVTPSNEYDNAPILEPPPPPPGRDDEQRWYLRAWSNFLEVSSRWYAAVVARVGLRRSRGEPVAR